MSREFDFYPLEDRILLSGDGLDGLDGSMDIDFDLESALLSQLADADGEVVGDGATAAQQPLTPDEGVSDIATDDVAEAVVLDPAQPIEVVFVDAGVEDAETLLANLRDGSEDQTQWLIVRLQADQDGILQITETLRNLTSVDAIHLLSHGDGRGIQLGNTRLDLDAAPNYAGEIAAWGNSLDSGADLLIYGSNLASTADGRTLIDSLAALCDCDVAASVDATGSSLLDGDWDLEYSTGNIETQIAFSSDVHADWHHVLDSTAAIGSNLAGETVANPLRHEIVFVDTATQGYQQLVDDLLANQDGTRYFDVVLLDQSRDGIDQISETLRGQYNVDAVHIVSHGADGAVRLGNIWLTTDNLAAYEDQLSEWASAFSEDGDLLLYGCDLAASPGGIQLVDQLSVLTGTDIAASTNLTGYAPFGGDWQLEYEAGQIETLVFASSDLQEQWVGLMSVAIDATSTGTSTGGNFSITHTTSGTDRLMLVGVSLNKGIGNAVTSVTYNGSNLTLEGTQSNGDAVVYIWSLVNPSLGTHSVNITVNGTTDGNTAGVMTFTGVDQSTPLGAFASGAGASGGTGSVTVSSAPGDLVFAAIAVDDAADYNLVPGAGQTEHWDLLGGGDINGGGSTEAGATSVVMDWTWSGSDNWAAGGISIQEAVNTAPTLDASQSPAFDPITEDAGAPSGAVGTLISDLVDFATPSGQVDNVTDPDSGAELGIAVTGTNSANGTWYYTTDNGSNWLAVGSRSDTSALLLEADANTRLYFQPNANYNGTIADAITFRAWDQTSGSNGSLADTTGSGGSSLNDTFTAASNIAITAHTPDNGTGWTEIYDTSSATTDATIDASLDTVHGGSDQNDVGQAYTLDPAPTGADQAISFTLSAIDTTDGTKPVGVFGRRVDNDNFYYLQILPNTHAQDSLQLSKLEGGVRTVLASIDLTISASDTFKLEITDDAKKIYRNGVEVLSSADNTLTASGTWGMYFGDFNGVAGGGHLRPTWGIDNFLAENLSAPTAFSAATDTASLVVTAVPDAPIAVDDHHGISFDGVDDYVSLGSDTDLVFTNTMTMEVWARPTAYPVSSSILLNKEGEYEIGISSTGSLMWAFANTTPGWSWHDTGHVLQLNEWAHVSVTYDNGTINTYVNGHVVETYNGSGAIGDAHLDKDDLRVGGRENNPAGNYFTGEIDDVRVWSTVRTQTEIQNNLDTTLTGTEPGLAGYWNFNEGSGVDVNDLTGNSANGTLTDGPTWTGYSTDQNTAINIAASSGVLRNDIDGDGDTLTVSQVQGSAANVGSPVVTGSGAVVTVNADGSFDYDPNGAFDYLAAGESGSDTFSYTVSDGNGGTDTATVTVTINGSDDAPTIVAVSDLDDSGNQVIDFQGGDDTITLSGLPVNTAAGTDVTVEFWMNWDGVDNVLPFGFGAYDLWFSGGNIGFNTANSDLYGTSNAGLATGWHHIAAVFRNGDAASSRLIIDGVEQTLSQISGTPNNSNAYATSTAQISGWGYNASYKFEGQIDQVRIWNGGRSETSIRADMFNELSGPQTGLVASYSFTGATTGAGGVIDDSGNGHHGTMGGMTAANVISGSGFSNLGDQTVNEDDLVTLEVSAFDPENSALTYTWTQTSGPAVTLSDVNAEKPTFTALEQVSDYQVVFTVDASDGTNATTETVTITVNAVNDAPTITSNGGGSTAAINVFENVTAVTTVTSSDADGGAPVYSIVVGDDSAKFDIDSSTGVLTFISAPDFENPTDVGLDNVYDVIVQVSDGTLTDTQAISVTIIDVSGSLVVTTTADNNDSGIIAGASYDIEWLNANQGADNAISLREAIIAANNTANIDVNTPDAIHFDLSTADVNYHGNENGQFTITLTSALDTITDAVIIDGSTQSNFVGTPVIELVGDVAGAGVNGLNITAGNSTIRALVITGFDGDGIHISGAGGNTIEGNIIGLRPDGSGVIGGAIGGWNADDGANDIVSNNDGVLVNGATVSDGIVGQAFEFDGVDDYIDLGQGPEFDLNNFTMQAWVEVDATTNVGDKRIISRDDISTPGAGGRDLVSLKSSQGGALDGHAAFGVMVDGNFASISSSSALTTGWHHIVGMRDGNTLRLYVDGVLVASTTTTVTQTIRPNANLVLGQVSPEYNGEFFQGKIDEAAVFGRALSAEEILASYNAQFGGKSPTLTSQVAYLQGENSIEDARGLAVMTTTGTIAYTDGIIGNAFDFGATGTIDAVDPDEFNQEQWTNTFWFNADDTTAYPSLMAREFADGQGYTIHLDPGGEVRVRVDTAALTNQVVSHGTGLDDSQWHFVAVTHDGASNTITLSVDGAVASTFSYTGEFSDPTGGKFTVGGAAVGTSQYGGLMDEIQVHGRVLSATELTQLYNSGLRGDVGNAGDGMAIVSSAGNLIGGATAAARNVISDSGGHGISISGADGTIIQGNFIGTNVTGTMGRGNLGAGILVSGNNTIIGTDGDGNNDADEGNLIADNDIGIDVYGDFTTIAGNEIGMSGTSQNDGIRVRGGSVSNIIGGTADDTANTIHFNTASGVAILPDGEASLLGNAINSNTGLQIDINDDGASANDGDIVATEGNDGMDSPTITTSNLQGTTLSLDGFIGISSLGDTDFAGARVEFFTSDGNGALTYLGFLIADANGLFSGNLTVSGLTVSDTLIATATNSGASVTSEFGQSRAVNTKPILTANGPDATYTEDDPFQLIDPTITVTDADGVDFDGGVLTVHNNSGQATDNLAIIHQGTGAGEIEIAGLDVKIDGITVASVSGGVGASSDLVVTFTAAADAADVQAVARRIGFFSTSQSPDTTDRTIDITITDGDGGTSTTENATVKVVAVNDAPVVNAPGSALAATEQVGLAIQGTGFTVTDVDAASGTMTATINVGEGAITVAAGDSGVSISSGNGTGTVTITGTLSQLDNLLTGASTGTITYLNSSDTPTASTTITVTVNDSGNTGADPGLTADGSSEEGSASQTINITAINDDPTNPGGLPSDITVTENESGDVDLSQINLNDVDHGGGNLTITLTTATGGNLSAASGGGVTIGGSGSGTLTLTGTLANLNTYLDTASNIQYLHSTANLNGDNADSIVVKVNDNGNTGSGGGTDINLGTVNVDITAVNDAPVLDNSGTVILSTITKYQTDNDGQSVASIIASAGGDRITDPDTGDSEGIAITSLSSGNGTWQYSTDGGSSWNAVGTVTDSSALLLRDTDLVRFVPNPANGTTASFTFRAWDQTSGTEGTKVNVSVNGDATAFSTASETASITVVDANAAPVLDNSKNPALDATNEDAGAPSGTVGTLVSSLVDFSSPAGEVDNVSDADSGAALGIAITAVDTTYGTWFYSIDNGSNWNALGAVSDANARLLSADADTRVYLQPNADYHGTLANAITFRAWDQTTGSNGGFADTSFTSDTYLDTFSAISYSNNNGSLSWSTDWIENDSGGGGASGGKYFVSGGLLNVGESSATKYVYREANLSAATTATLSFDLTTNNLGGGGAIHAQVSSNGGSTWTTLLAVTSGTATGTKSFDISAYTASNTQIRFYDNNGGGKEILVDNVQIAVTTSLSGGTTAFSSNTDTASLTINPVADTPSVTDATTDEDTQSTSGLVISRNAADGAEVTYFKITGITNGTLYKNDGVTQITNGSFITVAEGTAGLKFTPDADFSGTGNFTIQASTSGNDTGLGGSTTVANVTVDAVNDAPVITGGPDSLGLTETDAGLTGSGSFTVSDVDTTDNVTAAVDSVSVGGTGSGSLPAGLDNNTLQSFLTVTPTAILDGTENSATLAWNFNSGSEAFNFLATGETLVLTYTVSATDDNGTPLSDTETVTVTITGTNDAPVITGGPDTLGLTETNAGLTGSGAFTVTDQDTSDLVTAAVESVGISGTGSGSVPGSLTNTTLKGFLSVTPTAILDGNETTNTLTWNFNSGSEAFDFLANGETLILTYTVSATDDDGTPLSDTETITVTITGTNDQPAITVVDVAGAVMEDASTPNLTDSGSVTFAEVDETDLINSSVALSGTTTTGPTIPSGLATALASSVSITQTGTNDGSIAWDFSIDNSLVQYLADGETITATYTITVTDDSGTGNNTTTQDVVVTITGTNDQPTITVVDVTGAVTEDATTPNLTDSGSVTFAEVDDTDLLNSSVALSGATTTGPAIPSGLATALASSVSITQTGTNDGSIAWNFSVDNSLVQYLADGETITATYTITVTDDSGTGNNTTTQDVTVTITGTNDQPTITVVDVTGAVTEDATTPNLTDSGSVTFAEVDESDLINSSVALSGTTTTGPAIPSGLATALASSVSITQTGTNDGSIAWDFSVDNSLVQYLADGETITATYTITVTDNSGTGNNTTTQDVTVTITGTNDQPTITVVDVTGAVTEDATTPNLTDSGSVTFAEVDDTDLLNSSVALSGTTTTGPAIPSGLATALASSVSITQTGTNDGSIAWDFSVDNSLVQYLADGETITATYTITVSDDSGTGNNTTTQDVTVTITGTNDQPTITVVDVTGAVTEDATTPNLTDSGSVTFAEVDESDLLNSSVALSGTSTTGPAIPSGLATALASSVSLTQSGSNDGSIAWDFSVDNSLVQYLADGETITATYTITVTDNSGTGNNTTTQDVTITITGTNDQPTITVVDVTGAVTEDATTPNLTDSGSVTFAEVDDTDLLNSSVALSGTTTTGPAIPSGLATALASSVSITQTGTNDGSIAWDFSLDNGMVQYLADGETITATYTITVTDDSGTGNNTTTQDVVVTITGTNDQPTITVVDVTGAVTEDATTPNLTDSGSVTFAEVDDTDLLNSSVALSGATTTGPAIPSGLATALASSVSITQTGSNDGSIAWDFSLDNSLVQYLADGETITATYTITVTDDSGTGNNTTTQDVTVTITGTNDQPTITVVDVTGAVTEDATTPNLTDSGSVTFAEVDESDLINSSVALSGTTTTGPAIPSGLATALASSVNLTQTGSNDGSIAWDFSVDNSLVQYLADGETITATYTITVGDDSGTANNTTTRDVTVTITGTNDQPTITVVDVTGAVTEDATTPNLSDSGSVTFAEVDDTDLLNSSVALSGTTTTGPTVPAGLATALSSAVSLTQTGTNDGSIAWDFSVDNSLVQYLADGETITATYTITVTDDSGTGNNTTTQDVTVTITGTNDQPTITVVDVTGDVTEDATTPNLTDSGSVTFAEVEDTDTINSSVALSGTTTTGPAIPSGLATALATSVSITQTGTNDGSIAWDFSLDNSLVQYLADGETITATYTITVTDDSGTGNNTTTQDVTVTITGTNDAPVAGVDTATATEAGGISNSTSGVDPTGNVLANDTDVDTTDSKSVSGVVAGNAANAVGSVGASVAGLYGSVTIQSDGNYVYNVDNGNSSVEALRTSADTLEDVFTYTMVDSEGASSTQQITITIQGVNDAPNDLTATGMTIDENLANGQVVGTVSPSDVDSGDTASYRLTDDASGRFDIDSSGNVVVLDSSRLDYETDTQHDITVEVTDTAGGTYLETFTVTINDVDEYDVVALGDSDASANQVDENASGGVYVGITVGAVDADASNSTITHTLVDDAGGRFEIDANTGQIVTASAAPLNYEVDTSHDVTVRSVSADGSEVFQTYTIDILDINESSVAVDDSYSTISGQSISLTTPDPIANDTDPDGDALRLVLVTGPSNGTLSIDVNGVITYTPTAGFFGIDSFTYRSDDGSMLSDNIATVSITVQAGAGAGGGSGSGGSGSGGSGDSGSGDSGSGDGNGDTSGSGDTSGGDSGDGDSSDVDAGSTTGAVPLVPANVTTPNQSDDASNEKGQSKQSTASVSRDSTIQMTDSNHEESDHGLERQGFSWGGSSNMHMKRGNVQMSQMLDQLLVVDLVQAIQWTEWNNADGGPPEDSTFFGAGELGGLGVGAGLASVGYVLWALRGGVLLTTIFGSLPAWRMIDPSALLSVYRESDGVRKSKADVTTFLD
mgnify:CR=1 FL=1